MRASSRWGFLAGVLVMVGLLVPAAPLRANHLGGDDAPGVIVCDFTNLTVLAPGSPFAGELGGLLSDHVNETRPGVGSFGGARVPPDVAVFSTGVCSGALNGTAIISGNFTNCDQEDDNGDRHGGPSYEQPVPWEDVPVPVKEAGIANEDPDNPGFADTGFLCNGLYGWPSDEPVFDEQTADETNIFGIEQHTVADGIMDGQGWVWDSTTDAPDCEFASSGHAPAPVELETVATCPAGDGPTHLIRFKRPQQAALFTLLFGPAQDQFHRVEAILPDSDEPDFQHCFDNSSDVSEGGDHEHVDRSGHPVTTTWAEANADIPESEKQRCFRSTMSVGQLWGTVEKL